LFVRDLHAATDIPLDCDYSIVAVIVVHCQRVYYGSYTMNTVESGGHKGG